MFKSSMLSYSYTHCVITTIRYSFHKIKCSKSDTYVSRCRQSLTAAITDMIIPMTDTDISNARNINSGPIPGNMMELYSALTMSVCHQIIFKSLLKIVDIFPVNGWVHCPWRAHHSYLQMILLPLAMIIYFHI